MNGYWLAAGAVCLVTTAFHVFAGGVRVVRPMLASDLSDTVKAVLYGCWHAFTLLYLAVAACFLWAAVITTDAVLAQAASIVAGLLAILSAGVIMRFGQRFRRLPHWLLFTIASALGAGGILS